MKQRRDKLLTLRKNKRLTQKNATDLLKDNNRIEITESYYGIIDQGARTPSLNIILAISELFQISPNEIFFETNPNKKMGNKSALGGDQIV